MTKKFFGYVRVSTKKQGNGASLPEQKAAITAYAERNGLTIVRWFSETRTAAKAGRQAFNEILRELRRGHADGVVIHRVDRGARNLHDWADVSALVDRGIEVRFAHDDVDLTTRGGRLTADIQAVIAADFIRNNREMVRIGMSGWVKRGYYPWPAPIGYLDPHKKHSLKTIDPRRGPLVAKAFELYATGAYSIDTLCEELARRGLVRSRGGPLARNTVARMLRNPFYVGLISVRHRTELFEGKHEPLITQELFDRVQALLNGRVFPRMEKPEFMLRRLIRCGACPRTLTGERQKGHVYYRCHSASCRGGSISEAELEACVIVPALAGLEFNEGELGDLREAAADLRLDLHKEQEARAATIELGLAKVASRLQRLTDLLLDATIDDDTYAERKSQLLLERNRLQEAKAAAEPTNFWESVLARFELGSTALRLYRLGNCAEKRRVLISLGSNFTAIRKHVEFSTYFPLGEALGFRSVPSGAPSRAQVRTKRR